MLDRARIATIAPGQPTHMGADMPKIIPALCYKDAPAAIEWLCRAFGFVKHLVVADETGGIAHAELVLGTDMIMLGSIKNTELYRFVTVPNDIEGRCTVTLYVVVDDPDEHHARAVAAGASIVRQLTDQDYGGRDYTCVDTEGHVWTFGSYAP